MKGRKEQTKKGREEGRKEKRKTRKAQTKHSAQPQRADHQTKKTGHEVGSIPGEPYRPGTWDQGEHRSSEGGVLAGRVRGSERHNRMVTFEQALKEICWTERRGVQAVGSGET
jgi:hypothetical protein